MNHSTSGLPVHHQLPEFTQIHVHRVSDAIQPSHPLSSPSPPAPNPSQHQSLSNESTLRMRWPKDWSFSFSIIPSKEIPGLISFRMEWLDQSIIQLIRGRLLLSWDVAKPTQKKNSWWDVTETQQKPSESKEFRLRTPVVKQLEAKLHVISVVQDELA